jgi:hypothetical protein
MIDGGKPVLMVLNVGISRVYGYWVWLFRDREDNKDRLKSIFRQGMAHKKGPSI